MRPGNVLPDFSTGFCYLLPQDSLQARFRLADFYPLEKLPVMHTMALFRFLHCPKRYWAFQDSELFWPGPVAE